MSGTVNIREAVSADVPLICALIRELAEYEKLLHEAIATEDDIRRSLFGPRPYAEALIAEVDNKPVGFALFFHNFSTFHGRPGLYLEDLFVRPEARGAGVGRKLLEYLARLAVQRNCARFEWAVLDWNTSAIEFYQKLGARHNEAWLPFRLTGEAMKRLAGEHPSA